MLGVLAIRVPVRIGMPVACFLTKVCLIARAMCASLAGVLANCCSRIRQNSRIFLGTPEFWRIRLRALWRIRLREGPRILANPATGVVASPAMGRTPNSGESGYGKLWRVRLWEVLANPAMGRTPNSGESGYGKFWRIRLRALWRIRLWEVLASPATASEFKVFAVCLLDHWRRKMKTTSVLCPIDYSPASLAALKLAVAEAKLRGANLDLMHVWQPGAEYSEGSPPIPFESEMPREKIESDLASLPVDFPTERIRLHATAGEPRHGIVEMAKQLDSELVVMGTHAHHGLKHWIVGGVCEEVLRTCPCPVLVCRGPGKAD